MNTARNVGYEEIKQPAVKNHIRRLHKDMCYGKIKQVVGKSRDPGSL